MEWVVERCIRVWLLTCVLLGCANFYLKSGNPPSAESLAALYEYHLALKRSVIEQIKAGQTLSIRPDNADLKNRDKTIAAIEQDIIDLGALYRDDLNSLPQKHRDYILNLIVDTIVKSTGIYALGMLIGWVFISFLPKKISAS